MSDMTKDFEYEVSEKYGHYFLGKLNSFIEKALEKNEGDYAEFDGWYVSSSVEKHDALNHSYHFDAYGCLINLVDLSHHAKLKEIRYPSIKYASSVEEGWREFTLCFHKDREKVYQDMLRPKYKNGNKAYRIMGN